MQAELRRFNLLCESVCLMYYLDPPGGLSLHTTLEIDNSRLKSGLSSGIIPPWTGSQKRVGMPSTGPRSHWGGPNRLQGGGIVGSQLTLKLLPI